MIIGEGLCSDKCSKNVAFSSLFALFFSPILLLNLKGKGDSGDCDASRED